MIQGGAGAGKSAVIDILAQRMDKILRKSGDIPDHPYIIKCAFTGTAAANIDGQTLTTAFSFNFGNKFLSLTDKARDQKRNQLENLVAIIIDEFSMIKSDLMYQLDLRLREVKERPDVQFGGVSIFLFGDILQLRPVMERWIFEEPRNGDYHLSYMVDPLWQKANVLMLVKNHRQDEDQEYANILNRIRIGQPTEEDIKILKTRVRLEGDPEIPDEALRVMSNNKDVNRYNEKRLNQLGTKEHIIEAITLSRTQKELKPQTDNTGAIVGTQLQKTLKLKIGAKVMITANIDTKDSLTNGTFGEIVNFETDGNGKISAILIDFKEEKMAENSEEKGPICRENTQAETLQLLKDMNKNILSLEKQILLQLLEQYNFLFVSRLQQQHIKFKE